MVYKMDEMKKELLRKEVSRLFEEYGRENNGDFVLWITHYLTMKTGYTFDWW